LLEEKILIRSAQIISVVFVLSMIYMHFFGWFYPKAQIVEETREYLLTHEGYDEMQIISIDGGFDRQMESKYYARAIINDDEQGFVYLTYVYDVEENIYKLGEK